MSLLRSRGVTVPTQRRLPPALGQTVSSAPLSLVEPAGDQLEDAARGWRHSYSGSAAWAVLVCLGVFLTVKVLFRQERSDDLLYAYGVAVTSVVTIQMLVALTQYRDPAVLEDGPDEAGSTPPPSLHVSCLVAVHNEVDAVEACLRSMLEQSYASTEVIVVDDASTDGSGDHLDDLAQTLPIQVIRLSVNVGKKAALAKALEVARGDIIAFTDSDTVWSPDAVERCVRAFAVDESIGAVSGHCRALNASTNALTKMQDAWYEGQFSVRKAFESHFGSVSCVSGPLAVFRRAAIHNYVPAWQQDRFLGDEFRFATDRMLTGFVLMGPRQATRLRRLSLNTPFETPEYPHHKWKAVYCKSARCWTTVPDHPSALLKQQIRWKKSFLRNMFFTGAFYWHRPLVVATAFYLHIMFVLAGPFVAFRHLVYLPMHGSLESMVLYLGGITFIGSMFALAYRREDSESGPYWRHRLLMSLTSTLVLSWLIGYSLLTIKKMNWSRG